MLELSDDDYNKLKVRYKHAAKGLDEYLRELLKMAKIKALLSRRVKDIESLNNKLKKPEYNDIDTIEALCRKIKDIAGVRVAVYYPSDKWEVEALLYEYFRDVTQTTHPTEKEQMLASSAMRFEGYSAEHYVVPIAIIATAHYQNRRLPYDQKLIDAAEKLHNPPDGVEGKEWQSVHVELQVASLPLHTWSEPNHTLSYKKPKSVVAQNAEPTWVHESRKRAILDALNGLAVDGEVLLEMLKWDFIDQEPFSSRPVYEIFKNDHALILQNIERTKCSCWLIGQNHYGLLCNDDGSISKEAEKAISESSCIVNFVIADINDEAVRENVTYAWGKSFIEDWKKSFLALRNLKNMATNKVHAYVSSQVGRQSLLFFDPESSIGEVFLIRTLSGTKPSQRPMTRIKRGEHYTRFIELWEKRPHDLKDLPE